MISKIAQSTVNGFRKHMFWSVAAGRICEMVATDVIVHSLPSFYSNHDIVDFFWHYHNGSLLPYIFGSSNSTNLPIQVLASLSRFNRYAITSTFSIIDPYFSNFVYLLIPTACFSPRNSRIRQFKRKMLTCVRNGGVYKDIGNIELTKNIQTDFARTMSKYHPIFDTSIKVFQNNDNQINKDDHNKVYIQNHSKDYRMNFEELRIFFEKETQLNFNSVFKAVSEKPAYFSNDTATYDAILSTGEDVSLSVLPPNRLRLRNIDLSYQNSLAFILNLLSIPSKTRSKLNYNISRLSFDFDLESRSRQEILTSYGINFQQSPKQIFEDVRKLNLPLFIPAPLKQYSTKHIMVSDRKLTYSVRSLSAGNVDKLAQSASDLLFGHQKVIPDLSPSNLKIEDGRISLEKFHSLKTIKTKEIEAISNMVAASALSDSKLAEKAAKLLKCGLNVIDIEMMDKYKNSKIIRDHANAILSLAEMRACLYGHIQKSGNSNAIHHFSKPIAKIVGAWDEKPIYSYLDRRAFQTIS